jgi:hypothetical protein
VNFSSSLLNLPAFSFTSDYVSSPFLPPSSFFFFTFYCFITIFSFLFSISSKTPSFFFHSLGFFPFVFNLPPYSCAFSARQRQPAALSPRSPRWPCSACWQFRPTKH